METLLLMKKYRKAESKNENFFVRNKKRKVDHVFGDRLHMICSGGAYLNRAWISLFERYGITILQGYGMTECAPVISTNLAWNKKAGSVGKLMPNCAAKVVEEEIWVKGSSVMQGGLLNLKIVYTYSLLIHCLQIPRRNQIIQKRSFCI
ncbi:MAG: AMP-binding protein [Eubacterium sp.]|nr:AMP-binding protein [Eubacterium sp.]